MESKRRRLNTTDDLPGRSNVTLDSLKGIDIRYETHVNVTDLARVWGMSPCCAGCCFRQFKCLSGGCHQQAAKSKNAAVKPKGTPRKTDVP
jgi:hypothetical protein